MSNTAAPATTSLSPIRIGEGTVAILDQALLPFREAWLTLGNLEEAAHAIRSMQVRGAPLIGVTAACGVALGLQDSASDAALEHAVSTLWATRPTAVNLHWALARVRALLEPVGPAERGAKAWAVARQVAEEDAAANRAIGEFGCQLIERLAGGGRAVNIMTHCNAGWLATAGYGTALAPIYAAQGRGIGVHVYVSETRPRNQGLLTAWELGKAGVPHTLIADNAAGILLQRGAVDMVIVGADRIAANGDVANKVGTYLKGLAAQASSVPFYVAAPCSTVDGQCPSGRDIPIEERDGEEFRVVRGATGDARIAAIEEPVGNPAFDVTPAALVTAIITERGAVPPQRVARLLDAAAAA